jgi:hypothetical protein
MALVDGCRGNKTLRQVLEGLTGPEGPSVEPREALPVVRRLVEQGFLLPPN